MHNLVSDAFYRCVERAYLPDCALGDNVNIDDSVRVPAALQSSTGYGVWGKVTAMNAVAWGEMQPTVGIGCEIGEAEQLSLTPSSSVWESFVVVCVVPAG